MVYIIRDWKCTKEDGRRKLEVSGNDNKFTLKLTRYTETSSETFSADGTILLDSNGDRILEIENMSNIKEFTLKQVSNKLKGLLKVHDTRIK